MWAVIVGSDFTDGVIEVDVSGARRTGLSLIHIYVTGRVVLEDLAHILHPERQAGRIVDHDIPFLTLERRHVARVAIALELHHALGQTIVSPTAIEDGNLVAAL